MGDHGDATDQDPGDPFGLLPGVVEGRGVTHGRRIEQHQVSVVSLADQPAIVQPKAACGTADFDGRERP